MRYQDPRGPCLSVAHFSSDRRMSSSRPPTSRPAVGSSNSTSAGSVMRVRRGGPVWRSHGGECGGCVGERGAPESFEQRDGALGLSSVYWCHHGASGGISSGHYNLRRRHPARAGRQRGDRTQCVPQGADVGATQSLAQHVGRFRGWGLVERGDAQQGGLPAPFGPSTTQRSPGADLPRDVVEDPVAVEVECDVASRAARSSRGLTYRGVATSNAAEPPLRGESDNGHGPSAMRAGGFAADDGFAGYALIGSGSGAPW